MARASLLAAAMAVCVGSASAFVGAPVGGVLLRGSAVGHKMINAIVGGNRRVARAPLSLSMMDVTAVTGRFKSIASQSTAALQAKLPMRSSIHPSKYETDSWIDQAYEGAVKGWTAEPKVGWISESFIETIDNSYGEATVLLLMGPSYEVPHMWQSMTVQGTTITCTLDLPPRMDADGLNYGDYAAQYITPVSGWKASILSNPKVTECAPYQGKFPQLASPSTVSFTAPADDETLNLIERACADQVAAWCNFIEGSEEVNRMLRGKMFARDTQQQRARFFARYAELEPLLGKDTAQDVTSSIIGPGDEQYVGSAGDNSE